MIKHEIHFSNSEFSRVWEVYLPYRLNLQDGIYEGFLNNNGGLVNETENWLQFSSEKSIFTVKDIHIKDNGILVIYVE